MPTPLVSLVGRGLPFPGGALKFVDEENVCFLSGNAICVAKEQVVEMREPRTTSPSNGVPEPEELSEIEGIGLKKTQEYGDEVVKLICEFLTRHGLLEKIAGGAMPASMQWSGWMPSATRTRWSMLIRFLVRFSRHR